VLVGVVFVVLLARRNGKRNRASAIASAHASGYGEGHAAALALASATNSTSVVVGQQSATGSGAVGSGFDYEVVARIVRAELDNDRLRAVRNGANGAGIGLGSVSELLHERQSEVGAIPGHLANGPVGVRRALAERAAPKVMGWVDGYSDDDSCNCAALGLDCVHRTMEGYG